MEELKGLRELKRIGKSWFVLYKYYEVVDHNETNWKNCSTLQLRKNNYEKTLEYHADWLKDIANSNENKLNTNKLGNSGLTIIQMAKEIYDKISR